MKLYFAPMEGVTSAVYRRVHARMFPGADKYFAPFIAPDASDKFGPNLLRDVFPENNPGLTLTPQVLCNRPEPFLAVARSLAEMGYEELDLNAGCPSATVFAKHKGSGMLRDLDSLDACLGEIFADCRLRVSVKTRMGVESASEFPAILRVYEKYPVSELIIHARSRAGMYKSLPDISAYAEAARSSALPLCYNGNIFSPAALSALRETLGEPEAVMIGRGAAANPALFRVLRGGPPLSRRELRDFHDALEEEYLSSGLSGQYTVARLKELWYYMGCLFPGSQREMKALLKARRPEDYRAAVECLFSAADLDPEAVFVPPM